MAERSLVDTCSVSDALMLSLSLSLSLSPSPSPTLSPPSSLLTETDRAVHGQLLRCHKHLSLYPHQPSLPGHRPSKKHTLSQRVCRLH